MSIFTDIRAYFKNRGITLNKMHADPLKEFHKWYMQAKRIGIPLHNAMMVCTAASDGTPSGRMVLLKKFSPEGFVFFTNYTSQKARELQAHPKAELVFYWNTLYRQVRISGQVSKLSSEKNQVYWRTRPRNSQLASLSSLQSQPMEHPDDLKKKTAELNEQFHNKIIPCPSNWGGYLVDPYRIEFWIARNARMNDRYLYTKDKSAWKITTLYP